MSAAGRTAETKDAINQALELFHRRWMLRVIWELRDGPMTFRVLQSRAGELSPTVLNQRLHELKENALVISADDGYQLTALGRELLEAFAPMLKWSVRWRRARSRARS